MTRAEALCELLSLPDEPCLAGKRTHEYTWARDLDRDAEVIKRDLATAYVQHRCEDHRDESCVVSRRRIPRLKLARRGQHSDR